jgi:hypothetical protein
MMRKCVAAGALAVAGLLAAGCSSGPAPAAPPTAAAGVNTGSNPKSLWISCLISHGAHIPPPGSESSGRRGLPNTPQFNRALQACRSLEPRSSAQSITTQDQIYYLRAARCMRAHGVQQFPDPVFANGGVHFPQPRGLNINAPQVQRAVATCRRLIPAGLPYSR